jgi:hypothetical protein
MAGVILERHAEIERAKRDPGRLAAPARLNDLAAKRERVEKRATGVWGAFLFEAGDEFELTGHRDAQIHVIFPSGFFVGARASTKIDPSARCRARDVAGGGLAHRIDCDEVRVMRPHFHLAIIAAGVAVSAAPAQVMSPLSAAALVKQVEVRRTTYGVPHIKADNLVAAGYAEAYVQSEDYGPRVALSLLRARGEMARWFGRDSINEDFINHQAYVRAVQAYPLLDHTTDSPSA